MNLTKLLFWKTPAADHSADEGEASQADAANTAQRQGNVIPLPASKAAADRKAAGFNPAGATYPAAIAEEFTPAPAPAQRFKGLLNTPELEAFFAANYFGFGRYNGSRHQTREALESGQLAMLSTFGHILADLAERRHAKYDRLMLARLDVETLSDAMADKLNLAGAQVQREMTLLREQITLCEQRRGWVLEAINRYQLGFDRGMREALDFSLLNT